MRRLILQVLREIKPSRVGQISREEFVDFYLCALRDIDDRAFKSGFDKLHGAAIAVHRAAAAELRSRLETADMKHRVGVQKLVRCSLRVLQRALSRREQALVGQCIRVWACRAQPTSRSYSSDQATANDIENDSASPQDAGRDLLRLQETVQSLHLRCGQQGSEIETLTAQIESRQREADLNHCIGAWHRNTRQHRDLVLGVEVAQSRAHHKSCLRRIALHSIRKTLQQRLQGHIRSLLRRWGHNVIHGRGDDLDDVIHGRGDDLDDEIRDDAAVASLVKNLAAKDQLLADARAESEVTRECIKRMETLYESEVAASLAGSQREVELLHERMQQLTVTHVLELAQHSARDVSADFLATFRSSDELVAMQNELEQVRGELKEAREAACKSRQEWENLEAFVVPALSRVAATAEHVASDAQTTRSQMMIQLQEKADLVRERTVLLAQAFASREALLEERSFSETEKEIMTASMAEQQLEYGEREEHMRHDIQPQP